MTWTGIRSLRWRILAGVLAVDFVLVVLLTFSGWRVMTDWLRAEVIADARAFDQLLGAAVAPLLAETNLGALRELVAEAQASGRLVYLTVRDADGARVLAQAGTPPSPQQQAGFAARAQAGDPVESGGAMHFVAPVRLAAREYGRLEYGLSLAQLRASTEALVARAAAIAAFGAAAAAALLLLVTGVLTRGLTRLAGGVRRLAAGERNVRFATSGHDEVAQVAAALDEMSRELGARIDALQASEALQRGIAGALAEGLLIQRLDGSVVSANAACAEVLGLDAAMIDGTRARPPGWRLQPEDGPPLAAEGPLRLVADLAQPCRDRRCELRLPDGRVRWLAVNVAPQHDGAAAGLAITSFADVTGFVEAQQALRSANEALEARVAERTRELQRAKEDAEAADRAKTLFLSKMSHELRTPLNAILGFAQLIGQWRGLPEPATKAAAQIERSGWHLLTLIEDVLDLSRIQAGVMRVECAPTAIAGVVAGCLQMQRDAAARRAVRIEADVPAALHASADPHRLLQVLNNLVSNGIKYNREGGALRVAARADGEAVEIAVADEGPGLTAAQLGRLFEPFERLGAERSATPGTGIGLVITRHLVEAMGGTLAVASEPGRGTVFSVRLRAVAPPPAVLPPPPAEPQPAGAPPAAPARRLLYVEDDPINAALMRAIVATQSGLEIEVAGTAAEGWRRAVAAPPDLLLLDVHLPDGDGRSLCRQLRADPRFADRPVVALTADATLAAGAGGDEPFDAWLTKPVDAARLLSLFRRLLQRHGATAPVPGAEDGP